MGSPSWSTAVSDGTIAVTATALASGRPRSAQGRQRTTPPGFVGIVLEAVRGRDPQLMGNTRPRQHPTVLVGGHGLDGGGADVDADCDGFG